MMISAVLVFGLGLGTASLTGCNSNSKTAAPAGDQPASTDGPDADDHAEAGDDHSGWWCVEHGVPEGECALCDTSLVAEFKAKGDWCEQHNRPESQCFQCDPKRFERFAARYEAKFGKQPPEPTE